MNQSQHKRISKFLSLILRHKPELLDIELDEHGWADVEELLKKINDEKFKLSFDELEEVVEQNEKQRFAFSEDRKSIRASQGHSIIVDLELRPTSPTEFLYHGTAEKNLASIREKGIHKGSRQYVHLSQDVETAKRVGMRYGKPIVLKILSGKMHDAGYTFYLSENGVWLTDHIWPEFIAPVTR